MSDLPMVVSDNNGFGGANMGVAKQEAFKLYLTGKLSKVMVVNICAGIISAYLAGSENKK